MPTFVDWIDLPENKLARQAVERVTACVASGAPKRGINPLFLHGPSGTGKTHLLSALSADVAANAPDRTIAILDATDLDPARSTGAETEDDLRAARNVDVLLIEDVQHLPPRGAEALVQMLDRVVARQAQLVLTASVGPALMAELPTRLTSRLAQGLVLGLRPLTPESRLAFLVERTKQRKLTAAPSVLPWIAGQVPGSARPLDGAVHRLEALARQLGRPATLDEVQAAFRTEADVHRPTVERIASRVGDYFHVAPKHLQSRRRSRDTLLPRQVGMYLARRLTGLSLQQIGAYFGGRDHSTVLHACRKVERTLTSDLALSGAVRQLHADLA